MGHLFSTAEAVATSTNSFRRYFDSLDWDHILSQVIGVVVQVVFFSLIFFVLDRVGRVVIRRTFERYRQKDTFSTNRVETVYTLVRNSFKYLIIFFYLYALLNTLGVPVGTLVAGAGILSLAIGLGAQGFVNDIVTGFFILFEQQFDVGDTVQIGAVIGTVAAVGLRTTQVKSADGTLNFIPNRNITIVSNLSRNNMRVLINLRLFPQADLPKVEGILKQVNDRMAPEYPAIKSGPELLGLTDLGQGDLAYQVLMYTLNGEQAQIQRQFLQAYINALTDAGIKLPQTPINLTN